MEISRYAEPLTTLAFAYGNEFAHHWYINLNGDEYVELIQRLKGIDWNKEVRWYPQYFPGKILGVTELQAHIVASDDRDATLIRMLL